jgi:hypothetical protein
LWLFEDGHICVRETDSGELQAKVSDIPALVQDKEDKVPEFPEKRIFWRDDIMLRSEYRQVRISFLVLILASETCQQKQAQRQILNRDFQGRISDRKEEQVFRQETGFLTGPKTGSQAGQGTLFCLKRLS